MECRTCLKVTEELQELFAEDCDLSHKIETISSIQILENDRFPSKICYSCVRNVHLLYDFRGIVRQSNVILENRALNAQNEETGESGNDTELLETDLIQIDEIKLELETESLDFNESVQIDEKVGIRDSETDNLEFNDLVKFDVSAEITNDDVDSLMYRGTVRKTNRRRAAAKTKIFNCCECSFTSTDYNFYRRHRREHRENQVPRSTCNICGKSITKSNLRKHLTNHTETPVTCKICGKVVKHKESLRGHMYIHQDVSFQCTYCGKVITNRKYYYRHLRRHKNGGVKTVKSLESETEGRDLSDSVKTVQDAEVTKDDKDKKMPRSICNICGKSITTNNLRKHLINHTDTPVTCHICGFVAKHKESLRGHMHMHKNVSLQCTHCDKTFTNRHSYYNHKQRHINGGVKTEKCPMCDKVFSVKHILTRHIRSHTGERPYPCEYCKKGFSSPHALKTHVRQHTNEKPFACDYCDMAFPQRVSLRTHLKSKHPDKTTEQQSS